MERELDLDLDNYSAADLLRLFDVSERLEDGEMKRAYRTVLRMHPDKSRLDKRYFLFFSAAYKQLKAVRDIVRGREAEECARRGGARYEADVGAGAGAGAGRGARETDREADRRRERRAREVMEELSPEEFSEWFNRAFEGVRRYDPERDGGHGAWLRAAGEGGGGMAGDRPASVRHMHEAIQQKKERSRALVKHRGYQELRGTAASGLTASGLVDPRQVRAAEKDYSGKSGNLVFTDVKKAYTESVIPVTEADAAPHSRRTLGQVESERGRGVRVPTREESEARLAELRRRANTENVARAHAYAQEMERVREGAARWNSSLYQLHDRVMG